MMQDDHIRLTEKQKRVYLAGFERQPNGSPYKTIIAHGAQGAGKSFSMLAGFIKWANIMHRYTNFAILAPTETLLSMIDDQIREIVERAELNLGLIKKSKGQWLKIDSNRFHFYPYEIEYDDEHRCSVAPHTFWGIMPAGAYLWQPAELDRSQVESIRTLLRGSEPKLWACIDAGDPENYWKTDYIDKEDMADTLAIQFDVNDVSDNPATDLYWHKSLIEDLDKPATTIEFKRAISGIWLPNDYKETNLLENMMLRSVIDDQQALDAQIQAADALLDDPPHAYWKALRHLAAQVVWHRGPLYPHVTRALSNDDKLRAQLKEIIRGRNRERRDAAFEMIDKAKIE